MLYTQDAIKKRKNRAQIYRGIVSIIGYLLLIPLLIYNISLIIQAVREPNKTPSFFGIKTYVIISGSMSPEFEIGDIVIVKEVKERVLKQGDIISFRQGQKIITHRIIEVLQEEEKNKIVYKTKGDNNNTEDTGTVDYDSIEGIMIGKIPFIGKVSLLMQGKITLFAIAFLVYIYFSHIANVNKRENRRRVKRLKYEESMIKGENENEKKNI